VRHFPSSGPRCAQTGAVVGVANDEGARPCRVHRPAPDRVPARNADPHGHDPGRVAVDVAVMLADGGEAIADLAVRRNEAGLFGSVASDPTAWRLLSLSQVLSLATAPGALEMISAGI
jgi:hypothetical protein